MPTPIFCLIAHITQVLPDNTHSAKQICLVVEKGTSSGDCDHYILIENKFARHWELLGKLPEIDVDVEIRESPGKGRGLFAMRDFYKGDLVGFYEGHRVNVLGKVMIYRAKVTELAKKYPAIDRYSTGAPFEETHGLWAGDKELGLIIDGGPMAHPDLDHVKDVVGRIAVCNSGNYQQSNM